MFPRSRAVAAYMSGRRNNLFKFNPRLTTFTPSMAKREGKLFAAAPMVQGNYDGTGTPDVLSFPRGDQIAGNWYENFDPYQGTISFLWTPEKDRDASDSDEYLLYVNSNTFIRHKHDQALIRCRIGAQNADASLTTVSGTTYSVVISWNSNITIDGTNYVRVSINDTHTFSVTSAMSILAPIETIMIGSTTAPALSANARIEALRVDRFVWFDGTYGQDLHGGVDLIAAHYNGGSFADISETIGSWDGCFMLPTNATPGALVTGTGDAWSHPHSSNLLTDGFCQTTYASSGWSDEGTPATGPSDITATERIYNWGYEFESDAANEGIYQDVTVTAGDDFVIRAIAHSDGTSIPKAILYDQTNTAEIGSLTGSTASTKTAPDVFIFTGEAPAGCTTLRVKIVNTEATGVTYVHQVELLDNLWDDPSFEAGTAITDIGTPTTSAQSAEQAHSGTYSWKVVSDAGNEGAGRTITATAGVYYLISAWVYVSAGVALLKNGTSGLLQDGVTYDVRTTTTDSWVKLAAVTRASTANLVVKVTSVASGATFYVDDITVTPLDPITLTATPASLANSTENGGIRVDGYDRLTQPITNWTATKGAVEFKYTPRHSAGDVTKFGNTAPYILSAYTDANYSMLLWQSTNIIKLRIVVAGATTDDTWDTTGSIVAGATYVMRVEYNATQALLKIDGVTRITLSPAAGINYGTSIPSSIKWGANASGINQSDAVFSAP